METAGRKYGQASERLILASASPRRAELLRNHGYEFEVRPPPHPEPDTHGTRLSPREHAEAASHFKARSVAGVLREDALVLGADTVVACEGRIFGKPADRRDACRILGALTGTTHEVITGVTLLDTRRRTRLIRHDVTRVTMRRMSPAEMEAYMSSGDWEGKAGAYGIQDHGDAFVECIEGSFTNVVGLPLELLSRMWGDLGLSPPRWQGGDSGAAGASAAARPHP